MGSHPKGPLEVSSADVVLQKDRDSEENKTPWQR